MRNANIFISSLIMAADPVLQGVDVQRAEDAIALGTLVSNAALGAPIGKRFGPGMQTRAGQTNFAPVVFDNSDLDGPGQAERLELTGKLLRLARRERVEGGERDGAHHDTGGDGRRTRK